MAEKLKNKVTDGFQKGHPYGELPPCIHVGILNFNQMISPNYYHKFCLMDEKTKEIYSRKFQFHMLELKKLKYAKEKQQRKPLYQWAKLIAAQTWEELEQESKGNKYMERALEEMIKISQDEIIYEKKWQKAIESVRYKVQKGLDIRKEKKREKY